MPPNFGDFHANSTDKIVKDVPPSPQASAEDSRSVLQAALNTLAHMLVGVTVAVTLWWAMRDIVANEGSLTATQTHVVLCIIGYQLIMAEAILCFSKDNGWSSPLKIKHKRLVHWVMQIAGSSLAIAGSVVAIIMKSGNNFSSIHGIMALVAMVCAIISLLNGLASLYAFELRSIIKPNINKFCHIFFGSATFIFSSVCLCYGLDKNSFRNWATVEGSYAMISLCICYTLIIIFNPAISLFNRIKSE